MHLRAPILICFWLLVAPVSAQPLVSQQEGKETEKNAAPGWVSKTLWYVPNRVMDLLDVFRMRVRVGPGWAVGARITDDFAFYGGSYESVYFGLPGPRKGKVFPSFVGREDARGLVLVGVDATDDMIYSPNYAYSEIGLSAHVLLLGIDAGFSPAEFLDFLTGWVGIDRQKDDFPRNRRIESESRGSILNPPPVHPDFPIQLKPAVFPSLRSRLDYLQQNVPLRLQGKLHALDLSLSEPNAKPLMQPPVTDLRLSIFYEMISGPNGSMNVDPDLKLHVELPNLEHQFSLFLQSSYDDDLPGLDEEERDDKGWSFGARRQMRSWNISTDLGVHTKWTPEIFFRVSWKPRWNWGEWHFGFQQRGFWENDDGFGSLTELNGYHWMGRRNKWLFRTQTAGKISESTEGLEWQQTLLFGHLTHLRDESRRSDDISINHCLDGYAFKNSVFGTDKETTSYRSTFVYRKRLYKDFVVLEVEPGFEWRDENQWTTQYRLDAGILLYF